MMITPTLSMQNYTKSKKIQMLLLTLSWKYCDELMDENSETESLPVST